MSTFTTVDEDTGIISSFLSLLTQTKAYRNERPVLVDGRSLSIPATVAVARYGVNPQVDGSTEAKERVHQSRRVLEDAVLVKKSIYGVTTGVGGSADTRSDDVLSLGVSILQQIQCGILSIDGEGDSLPISHNAAATQMPESWVRGALMMRMNSMIRGHSGVRWDVLEKFSLMLNANILPLVPLRGSISASGDLTPLSYLAGAATGNPSIRVNYGPPSARIVMTSKNALAIAGIEPLVFQAKEPLSVVNGTSFSAAVAALAVYDAVQMSLLALTCTALTVEALHGARGSFSPFIHAIARPHPGQVEAAQYILSLLEGSEFAKNDDSQVRLNEDPGILRQDRYAMRTSPQYLGPQLEDIYAAVKTIDLECNASSDNPLIEAETQTIHLGGNFQAMAVTNAMEKTRLALDHIGKLAFAQSSEILNPHINKGLPPSLAATDPSLNYHAKGLDVVMAAYVTELGYLANPVSTHSQAAEMHNESVNSMALLSARATVSSLEVLAMLIASHLYILCQALDLRAMQYDFLVGIEDAVKTEFTSKFKLQNSDTLDLSSLVNRVFRDSFYSTTTMDLKDQMQAVASSCIPVIVKFFTTKPSSCDQPTLSDIMAATDTIATRGIALMDELRDQYLTGLKGRAPACSYLGRTHDIYQFIRLELGVPMHGEENLKRFGNAPYANTKTIGHHVSVIYKAVMDGKMHEVITAMIGKRVS
ncbi:phenylalanine ammonia-lyase [Guyanagaster necrorhizus]|uniref:Phenylalanine ammonia-lyase n=1 Tax=Guyanagaster necrorhizus TaxID=856835 RepID=A0A9P7VLR0_9AGAR|nr:phenylalanine ammonia-lyase [Guyanagaster necrorhizus MCA 3950]KAG7442937.1 phenylalanine ammonia-lyase [Guyanagaster necrorhizus MCA 3950]